MFPVKLYFLEAGTFLNTTSSIVGRLNHSRGGLRRGHWGCEHPFFFFFCNPLIFYDYFEELKTVLIKVKLIINNAPLTYVYLNTIKSYLTPNHLLFARQLSYYSNTTSAVVGNLTILSSTTDMTNCISNHFWHRWRHEYVVNLCEKQQTSKLNINSKKICCVSL